MVSFVRADHIGRPVFATNTSGTQVWSASYLPFGGVHTATGSLPANRFPGQWFQTESGLHQNWMRDYDPTTGRYIQADPLGLIDGASVYGYVKQNPGRWIDPRGLETVYEAFRRNFSAMREANWKNSDKYFHCKANCEAVREFPNTCYSETSERYSDAKWWSDSREAFDRIVKGDTKLDSWSDEQANAAGRNGAVDYPSSSCQEICNSYRPRGLPRKY